MFIALYMRQGLTACNTTKQEPSVKKQQILGSNTNFNKKSKAIKQET